MAFLVFKVNNNNMQNGNYVRLKDHKGTKRYEVVSLLKPNQNLMEFLIYPQKRTFLLKVAKNKNTIPYVALQVNAYGNLVEELKDYRILTDGTIWHQKKYKTYLIDGNTQWQYYINPFDNSAIKKLNDVVTPKNTKQWLNVFKEYYQKANYVHLYMNNYYFKVDKQWYVINVYHMQKLTEIDFRLEYLPKINTRNYNIFKAPDMYQEFLDEQILQCNERKNREQTPLLYGYFDFTLPNGEVLQFKKQQVSESYNLKFYNIIESLGGNSKVFFIEELAHPNSDQQSKLYVVRPKRRIKLT